MDVVGLICHRAGSQRLPFKAMQLINGRPLAAYALDAVSAVLDKTWVYTDDTPLIQWLDHYPNVLATPFAREAALSQHHVPSLDVVKRVLEQLPQPLPQLMMLVQLTSPLLQAQHLQQALTLWRQHPSADSMVSVCNPRKPVSWLMPPSETVWLDTTPSPDAAHWLPNGAFYLFKTANVLAGSPLLSGHVLGYDMTSDAAPTELDVDTPLDFQQLCQWKRQTTQSNRYA